MTEAAPSVPPEISTVEAAHYLRQPDVPALVVCDAEDAVIGIVTESDIVAVIAERGGNRSVESFMSRPVVTTSPATPIGLAADRMRDAGISLLPVVDDDDTYEGLVTKDALAPYLSRHRLEIEWDSDPLSLDDRDTAEFLSTN